MADAAIMREGQVSFQIGAAFYRPASQIARDLAVLAATVYRQQTGQLRVLDAMSGCGVRALRYSLEAGADWIWANEANPDLATLLTNNLAALPPQTYRCSDQDASQVFFSCYQQRDFYDLVDIDNFGGPAPYAGNGLWATRIGGLLYLTSTDGRSSGGHAPERSLALYPAYARAHPAVHEQGLRLLIGHAAQQAASRGLGIEPVFSLFTGQVHRAMVRLVSKSTLSSQTYGFLGYCHCCGQFQTVNWRHLGRVSCACHGSQDRSHASTVVLSGPLWLGNLHDSPVLTAMEHLAQTWGWGQQADLIALLRQEIDLPPYYYRLRDIGRRSKQDIPRRDDLISALHRQGFRAGRTHLDQAAIKTDATFATCLTTVCQM